MRSSALRALLGLSKRQQPPSSLAGTSQGSAIAAYQRDPKPHKSAAADAGTGTGAAGAGAGGLGSHVGGSAQWGRGTAEPDTVNGGRGGSWMWPAPAGMFPLAGEELSSVPRWLSPGRDSLSLGQEQTSALAHVAAQGGLTQAHPVQGSPFPVPFSWAPAADEAAQAADGWRRGIGAEAERDAERDSDAFRAFALASSAAGVSVLPVEARPLRLNDLQLLAVPKRKVTPSRKGLRNGPKALKPVPVIVKCRGCGRTKLRHVFCCAEGDRLKGLHPQRHWRSLLSSAAAQASQAVPAAQSQAEAAVPTAQ